MAAVAIGDDIKQARAFLAKQSILLAAEGIDDSEGVVAVNALGLHGIGTEAGTDAGSKVVTHGFATRLSAHGVLVVHNAEQDGQTALHVAFPKGAELVHAGEGHALKDGAACQGAVADVADDNAALAIDLFIEGRADGDASRTTHDGVVGEDAEGDEEGVHGATQAFIETRLAGKDFSNGAVEEEADAQFLHVVTLVAALGNVQRSAAPELLHDFDKLRVAENLNGAEALGQNLAVATV